MLQISDYRQAESAARAKVHNWRMAESPWIKNMFFAPEGKKYTKEQLISMVKNRVKDLASKGLLLPAFPV